MGQARPKLGIPRLTRMQGALLGCVVLAFLLRVWGLRFGLPQLYYWDEPTVVNRAMRFGTGDLNPHFFYYPAFYLYVLFGASGGYFVVGKLLGLHSGALDFAKQYFTDPTGVYLTTRLTTALIGVGAVLAVYALAKRMADRPTALLAALLLAVSPLHASHSHIAITDVPHALLICLASVACQDVLTKQKTRYYALAGLLIGLGAATKYLAILNVASLVLSHLLAEPRIWQPRLDWSRLFKRVFASPALWLGAACTALGFFVGSPYNVLELGDFVADFRSQMVLSSGDAQQGALLLRTLLRDFGWPAAALAVLGLAQLLRKPTRQGWVFLCFPVVYGLLMLDVSKSFARYLLPQSAFIAVAAAMGVRVVVAALEPRLSRAALRMSYAALLALTLLWPLAMTLSWDFMQARREDTRTNALRWAEQNVPKGSAVMLQSLYERTFDNVPIVTDATIARLERVLPTSGSFGRVRDAVLDDWRARPTYHDVPWNDEATDLSRSGARYVFLTEAYPEPGPETEAWLTQHARQLRRFEVAYPAPLRWLADGGRETLPVMPPVIRIYELDPVQ